MSGDQVELLRSSAIFDGIAAGLERSFSSIRNDDIVVRNLLPERRTDTADIVKVAKVCDDGHTCLYIYSAVLRSRCSRPLHAEQQKIAECLSSLDELIAAASPESGRAQDP
jgi:hypothetical protein